MKNEKLKYVRIDRKTVIQVRADIPDQTAVNEFLLKRQENERKYQHYKLRQRWASES